MVFGTIILLNIIGNSLHFRLDLTKEKRYTLSNESKTILKNLEDEVFIRIYLDGELNIQLNYFQNSIKEMMEELQVYAGSNLQFQFTDPFSGLDNKKRGEVLQELYDKGLRPVNIHHRKKDGSVTEKIIIPGAVVSFSSAEIPLNLLLNDPSRSSEDNFNSSIESLEYTLISTIKNITNTTVEKVAFIEGHGEWPDLFVSDISRELSKTFQVDRGRIGGAPDILDPYSCIVIAGPVAKFSEADKFVIDQYIMKGGKVVWLLDPVNINLDSLSQGLTMAIPNDLNLDDMLFRYGIRLNPVLLRDFQCNPIRVNVALAGNEPNFQLAPWLYNPIFTPDKEHVISTNLNMVLGQFVSTIDTIEGRSSVKKTPLLLSSLKSGTVNVPAIIALEEINRHPDEPDLNSTGLIAGILLEGEFESVFKNRMVDPYFEVKPPATITKSKPTKMMVIADADFIRNDVMETPQGPSVLPLGYDRATNQTFGNKEFLVNAISYLTDDTNLLNLRGREFQLRLLDKSTISAQRLKWQLINILLPIIILIVLGIIYNTWRKQYYSKL